jgi:gluconolactonase
VSCSHGARRVERTEHDGSITTIADRYDGKRLNSPNDVVVASDGAGLVHRPHLRIDSDYEGFTAESEIGASYVYRVDPGSGEVADRGRRLRAPQRPGLLARRAPPVLLRHGGDPRPRRTAPHPRLRGGPGGTLSAARSSRSAPTACFDGFRFDTAGHLWTSAG